MICVGCNINGTQERKNSLKVHLPFVPADQIPVIQYFHTSWCLRQIASIPVLLELFFFSLRSLRCANVVSRHTSRRVQKGTPTEGRKKQVSLGNRAPKTLLSGCRQDVRRCLPAFSNSWRHHPPCFFFFCFFFTSLRTSRLEQEPKKIGTGLFVLHF